MKIRRNGLRIIRAAVALATTLSCYATIRGLFATFNFKRNSSSSGPRVLDMAVNDTILYLDDLMAMDGYEEWTESIDCVSFRWMQNCDPELRFKMFDRDCTSPLNPMFGYCEYQGKHNGLVYKVALGDCRKEHAGKDLLSIKYPYSCKTALTSTTFRSESLKIARTPAPRNILFPVNRGTHGVVMAARPKDLSYAYATIKRLRSTGCRYPVEIWRYSGEFTSELDSVIRALGEMDVSIHTVTDTRVKKFFIKIHMLIHTRFQHVLLLDADSIPISDITPLFNRKEYLRHGQLFWPDLWFPDHTIFGIKRDSGLWRMLGVPFRDERELESGQLMFDRGRRTNQRALQLLELYSTFHDNPLEVLSLAYGDKDYFRFAFMQLEKPYHIVATPPSSVGEFMQTENETMFCGTSLLQHLDDGTPMFLHRNTLKKKDAWGRQHEKPILTHIQTTKNASLFDSHVIGKDPELRVSCFGMFDYKAAESEGVVEFTTVGVDIERLERQFLKDVRAADAFVATSGIS